MAREKIAAWLTDEDATHIDITVSRVEAASSPLQPVVPHVDNKQALSLGIDSHKLDLVRCLVLWYRLCSYSLTCRRACRSPEETASATWAMSCISILVTLGAILLSSIESDVPVMTATLTSGLL